PPATRPRHAPRVSCLAPRPTTSPPAPPPAAQGVTTADTTSRFPPPPIEPPPGAAVMPAKATSSAMKPADSGMTEIVPPPGVVKKDKELPASPMAAGDRPILNTRTCTVNYQVEGPSRFNTRIDFWGTPDGGTSGGRLTDGSGGGPPARLTLPADGVWGIRIRPGAGLKPPEPLEDPDCVVEIDTLKPAVSLVTPTVNLEDGM